MEEEKNKDTLRESNSFLGKGWSFPPEFLSKSGSLAMTADADDIRKSLEILLSTRPGERVMQPEYGCDLSKLLFEPITTSLTSHIKDLVKTAILYYEPRIRVEDVTMGTAEALEGKILISIDFFIRTTNTRTNFVYPFYVQEATASIP
jgi:hypothetical protein